MRNYMIRRVGHSVFIILGLMAILFFAINVLGDPVELMLPQDVLTREETIAKLHEKYGLDRPMHVRLADYFASLLTGCTLACSPDFDKSIHYKVEARGLVLDRLPNTAALALAAWTIGILGVPIGIQAARHPRGVVDRFVNLLTFAVVSIPEFWLALMLMLIVAVKLDLLPTSGFEGLEPGGWKFMLLPAATLAPRVMGRFAQITRATVIDEIGKGYVATARAKGLAENPILYGHVLKNAAISIVTLMGDELAGFMNGSTVVEMIFGWPGLGLLLINAIVSRDLPVITASVFVIALMVMTINLIVDLIYTWLDPRISYK
ncbi:MAG: ABC transporter permease [Dehalococcoidia bacterium]|nr:ABC transporter permease [Dehalococcoidia bacterium]HJN88504.1 ABC transporter permease [Dehalococcoidia bacterium]